VREGGAYCHGHELAVMQTWGPELTDRSDLVSEFLESLEQFSRSLLGAKDNMNNHLVLTETEYAAQLDSLHTAADYRTASMYRTPDTQQL